MPMFIYHYMILNIIDNVPARGGADGFFPYYIGDTGSARQGEPEVFFVFKKPFALRLRLISGGAGSVVQGFFSQNWEESGCANRSPYGKLCRNTTRGKGRRKWGGAKIKKVQIFTNLYQKFEDFEAKPFTKVIKICIMPEGSTVWASHIHMARRLTYTV